MTNAIYRDLVGPLGYHLGVSMDGAELSELRRRIHGHWLSVIERECPDQATSIAEWPLNRYHEVSERLDHKRLWPKVNRILGRDDLSWLRASRFFAGLEKAFGSFQISNEEGVQAEEVYWRLVRPGQPSDVGPLHADAWFWALGHGKLPPGKARVKLWLSVYAPSEVSGFIFVSGSHRKDWRYVGELRDGIRKPVFDVEQAAIDPQPFFAKAGDAIIFHDRLLHGGSTSEGLTRVSVEFTMLVDEQRYPGLMGPVSQPAAQLV